MTDVKAVVVAPWKVIIGELVIDMESYVELKQPFAIEEILTEKGITIMPIPMSLISPSKIIRINSNQLICNPYDPPEDIVNMYIQATTGLVIPKQGFFTGTGKG